MRGMQSRAGGGDRIVRLQEGKFSKTAHRVAIRRAPRTSFLTIPECWTILWPWRSLGVKQPKNCGRVRKRLRVPSLAPFGHLSRHAAVMPKINWRRRSGKAWRNTSFSAPVSTLSRAAILIRWACAFLRWTILRPKPGSARACSGLALKSLSPWYSRRWILSANNWLRNLPAFFSWLGVVPYLTRESCMATLSFIAKMPPGSGVVFDFAVDSKLLSWAERVAVYALSRRVAAADEPFQLFFRPPELTEELKNLGFQRTEILGAEEINARYFTDRADGLRIRGGAGRRMGVGSARDSPIPCKISERTSENPELSPICLS